MIGPFFFLLKMKDWLVGFTRGKECLIYVVYKILFQVTKGWERKLNWFSRYQKQYQ